VPAITQMTYVTNPGEKKLVTCRE